MLLNEHTTENDGLPAIKNVKNLFIFYLVKLLFICCSKLLLAGR